jgi:hypothetical protein
MRAPLYDERVCEVERRSSDADEDVLVAQLGRGQRAQLERGAGRARRQRRVAQRGAHQRAHGAAGLAVRGR